MIETVIFHVDIDAFFAAVEILDDPGLAGKPLIVGGLSKRGVVSTASYEARKYGVHSAMPMTQALRLCPHATVIPGRHARYSEVSAQVMGILREFSSDVHQISIDEAFLDMSGTERLWGRPREAALKLKERVHEETGMTISVGIGPNRLIAKMASDYNKPDGLCKVSESKKELFIDAVGLKKLWGVGKVTQEELKSQKITTTGELRSIPLERLKKLFGNSMGSFLYHVVRGIDPGIFSEAKSRSISTEHTFLEDVGDREVLEETLLSMSHEVMFRSLDERQIARTIGVKIRLSDFSTSTVQTTPAEAILSAEQVYAIAKELLAQKWRPGMKVRLIGVGLYQLYDGTSPLQGELFESEHEKKRKLEAVVLALQKEGHVLVKAANLGKTPPHDENQHS
ncbi:MAG TPA: DNA polymerase IV [Sphaerochaeta sp.]|jgi:DNA polymerase-4|nr:DNA polymerase IV [Sphaerochaeta sp.]HQB54040.1 DNA polymerase IV [Sphaerochaeta sp.]